MARKWTEEEDARLVALVDAQSCADCPLQYRADCACKTFTKAKTWSGIGLGMGRTLGAVQGRWCSVLDPMVDRSPWTAREDADLAKVFALEKTWVTRARALARLKDGEGKKRRNGGDVCQRYFKA